MHFRIADTFTDSLAKLKDEEQKAVKTTAFGLQRTWSMPGSWTHGKPSATPDAWAGKRACRRGSGSVSGPFSNRFAPA